MRNEIREVSNIKTVGFGRMDDIRGIRTVFTTRHGPFGMGEMGVMGGMDFDRRKGENPRVIKSYEIISDHLGVRPSDIFVMNQVHGDRVLVLKEFPERDKMRGKIPADGVVTELSGMVLTVLTADCLPILMVDRKKMVIAAVHAGWRSSVMGIARRAVETMASALGSAPVDIVAALGPAIGPCCYEVGDDVVKQVQNAFTSSEDYIKSTKDGHVMLDLVGLNRQILIDAGLLAENIASSGLCTYCNPDDFYSYRREGPETGRMMGAIVLD